ncbi:MAG: TraB/GumN family protein [Sphingomonas sp.]
MEEALTAEAVRVKASQPYVPEPAIWKISDADTSIFIFGTVHSLPPGFRWRNPRLEGIIVRADLLLLESVETEEERAAAQARMAAAGPQPPLLDRVSHRHPRPARDAPGDAAGRDQPGARRDADVDRGDQHRHGARHARRRHPQPGADAWLEQHFRSVGKPVQGIEDNSQVMASIGAIPERAQRMMLEGALDAPSRTHEEMDATAHAWARGLVGTDSPLVIMPAEGDPTAVMADPLLVKRNNAWVDDLIRRLGPPGDDIVRGGRGAFRRAGSVLELLGKRGVRVERVQ